MKMTLKPLFRISLTLLAVAGMAWLISVLWREYVVSPWTRDGRVSAEVVQIAPEVSGTVVEVAIKDNQHVNQGDVLYRLDTEDLELEVMEKKAELEQHEADLAIKMNLAKRRNTLGGDIIANERIDQANGDVRAVRAAVDRVRAELAKAELDVRRATVVAPVDGYITNLHLRTGDYATKGTSKVAILDPDSFWITGYFEETKLRHIAPGDQAQIRLMGFDSLIQGHVSSIGRGVADTNDYSDQHGLPSVSPVFTWIRLAQRIPVRVHIDKVPPDVRLAAGMTCSVAVGTSIPKGRLLAWAQQVL